MLDYAQTEYFKPRCIGKRVKPTCEILIAVKGVNFERENLHDDRTRLIGPVFFSELMRNISNSLVV